MKEFKLDEHSKIGTGFKVPEQYFDLFPDKVVRNLPQREAIVIPMVGRRKHSWIYAVAAVLVLAFSIPTLNKLVTTPVATDLSAIESYIAMRNEISDDEIVDLMDSDDVERLRINLGIEDQALEDALITQPNLEQILY